VHADNWHMVAVALEPSPSTRPAPTVRAESRVAYIDGLRAVAVLGVVLAHAVRASGYLEAAGPLMTLRRPMTLLNLGTHGVDLFFVLSGFCLSYPTLAKLARQRTVEFDVTGYIARRLVRIVPPFLCSILLLAAIERYLGFMLPSAPNLLKQALFLDLNTQFINGSFWTLAVEARWYVLLPLALLLWSRNVRLFWFAFATVVVAGRFTMASSLDMLMLPGFLLGIAAAQVAVDGRRVRLWAFAGLAATIALALPISLSQVPGVWPIVGTNAIATIDRASLLWEVAAFCFILLAVSSRRLRAMLGLGPIAFIGAASYSIYLVHQPATMLAAGAVRSGVSQPELFAVCLAVSLAGGIAFWAVFERPIVHGQARSQLVRYLTAVFDRAAAQLQSATAFRLHR